MFFWSGTSADPGATCGGCQHFKTEHQNSIRGCCGKVRTRKNGATFDRRTPACKYFEITEREEARRAGATPEALHRRDPMDLRKYAGSSFVGLDDVRGGPIREEVVDAVDGEFEKLNLIFESGRRFSVNKTNTTTLIRLFGRNSENVIGQTIEFYLGEVTVNSKPQDSVLIRAVAPAKSPAARPAAPAPSPRRADPISSGHQRVEPPPHESIPDSGSDDDIPF
jgi:hypothetical protein